MNIFKGIKSFGALYHDNEPQPRPSRPWIIDFSILQVPYKGMELGNILEFESAPDWSRWWLGDTPSNPKNTLNWIVLEDNIQRLYICDRMILVRVSWQDLFNAGYVDGIKVVIDGQIYKCRLMTGGNDFHVDNDSLSGGYPTDNEWDRFVSGGENIKGLPSLTSNDKAGVLSDEVLQSPHNQFWNWVGAVSWTSTPYVNRDTARCCRGYQAGQFFYLNTYDHRHEDIGWRPILEKLL
jgi:hypothetical protein